MQNDHPTVEAYRRRRPAPPAGPLSAETLRALVLDAGADDVGFVELDRSDLADQRAEIERALPGAKALISIVCRMSRDNIRSVDRSLANLEFHHAGHDTDDVARTVVRGLEDQGVRAINGAVGFPMEADRWPGKMWVISHKPVAVAAGLGKMGIHRNIIHPRFGNFVLLATIAIDREIDRYDQPLDYNPCLECRLCVAACPTGAISSDGSFNFAACFTHNYREFMGGFTDWVETVADAGSAADYRARVSDSETVSMWQSLGFGPNYKAAYCLSVCPAGEDVIGPYLDDKKSHAAKYLRPLQDKSETVYVSGNSDAAAYVARQFPHKRSRLVRSGLRPTTIEGFLFALPHVFQREQAARLNAVYHFTFTGKERRSATITIRDRTIQVADGHVGTPDLRMTADSTAWLGFLRKDHGIAGQLLRRRIKIKGSPKLLLAFGRCFPD